MKTQAHAPRPMLPDSLPRCGRRALTTLALLLASAASAIADDSAQLAALLAPAVQRGGVVTIPPGDYTLDGAHPLPLSSNTTVFAYGARFHLPETLGDKARLVFFAGTDVQRFAWHGGEVFGHVFDPASAHNTWEPNVNTRFLLIDTSPGGTTRDLLFRDLQSHDVAGAVITVLGALKPHDERDVDTFASNVTLENCTLERSGKFMWDYGLLWQITVWPDDYTPAERAMAAKYFRTDLIRGPLRIAAGDDRVYFDNAKARPVPKLEAGNGRGAICFFGPALPSNIVRGRQYFTIESKPDYIRIAERPGGEAIHFASGAGDGTQLITDLFAAGPSLFAPTGSGPGKGAFDLTGCREIIVRGCRLSALGDTMHIQRSQNVVFSNNEITGSRMGAFFLAEYCKNAVITGNTVNGGNGSRVISVERSCEDVTMVGNTFRNGGRGSWINQPRNLVMSGNIFVNNTTKGEADPHRGRRSIETGGWDSWPELYFTIYEPNGSYGPVILRDNIFIPGPEAKAAVRFEREGHDILMDGNIFHGATGTVLAEGNTEVTFGANPGAKLERVTSGIVARTFPSAALGREVDYSVYLPSGTPPPGGWPVALLLHGAGRNHRTLAEDEASRNEVLKRRIAVVFADGANGWYLDSAAAPSSRFQTMLHELLTTIRHDLPVSSSPERTGICGWSMGGYGAMHFAETYPSEVDAVATTIGLLDFPNAQLPKEENFPVSAVFGKDESAWSKLNCISAVEGLRGHRILIIAAKGAFDYQMNRNFHARLEETGIAHDFREIEGGHDFAAVRASLPMMLDFFEATLTDHREADKRQ